MPVKHEIISCWFRETSLIATTLNQESNSTRREKNHFLFHWNILTSPGLLTRPWKHCRKAASMIIGTSMVQENCPIHGQVSHNSPYWRRKSLQTDTCGPEGGWRNGKQHQGLIICGQKSGEEWQGTLSWGRSINGQLKDRSSIMLEDYGESISLTLRTWNSRKSSKMQGENWKHQWVQLCLARHARKASTEKPVARWMISSLRLHVSWKPVNPQECVWKNPYRNIHEDHIAGKGDNSLQHHNLVHKFMPMQKAMKIRDAKAAVEKEWEKLEKISAWNLAKVRNKSDVINEARHKDVKVHFASLMVLCHLKNAE